jgi:hypothetical protein
VHKIHSAPLKGGENKSGDALMASARYALSTFIFASLLPNSFLLRP